MVADDLSEAITAHISSLLLRYFRAAVQADAAAARLDRNRDLEMLRLHWSISPALRALTGYILANRHETQSFLAFRVRTEDSTVRGRLDARATAIRRLITGHPSITVSQEPVRSFASGANHVVAWVLQQAWLLSRRFLNVLPADASYRPVVETGMAELDQVHKIEAIRVAMAEINVARRPGAGALREAARSRRAMYRLAYQAFMDLAAIEAGDPEVIVRVLRDTLLAPIKVWQRFELAVGLSLAEALEHATGQRMALNVLVGDSRTPIARAGRFGVFWQTTTSLYEKPTPEPSETIVRRVLAAYGMRPDTDRPDLIVTDLEAGAVVSVVEVKYFAAAGDDAWDRLRDATNQVVRYSRGYRDINDLDGLLGQSVIALVRRPDLPEPRAAGVPLVVDFRDLTQERIRGWADHLTRPPSL